MSKEDLINLKKELGNNCISLTKFLINYCGIYNDEIYNIKISHKDIKELVPQLKRVSFESLLQNKNGFYTGEIIPVKDCCGNVVPYINPMLEIDELLQINCEKIKEETVTKINPNKKSCIYELAKLCRYYKVHNKLKEYRITHKLLEIKKDSNVKQYKKKKDNLIMKGRGMYDEY